MTFYEEHDRLIGYQDEAEHARSGLGPRFDDRAMDHLREHGGAIKAGSFTAYFSPERREVVAFIPGRGVAPDCMMGLRITEVLEPTGWRP